MSRTRLSPAAVLTLAVLAALPTLAGGCSRAPLGLVGSRRTLTYCHGGGMAQTLDLYRPSSSGHAAPVLVDIHGGGWVAGDATVTPASLDGDVERSLVDRGWVFVSINYRLAPDHPWPAQIEDATCAIRFLRADALALHIDPDRMAVMGASAGGHLASLVGLAGNRPAFTGDDHRGQSAAVEAVVDLYGPTDLTSPDWASSPGIEILSRQTFGVAAGRDAPVLVAASPVTYVQPGAPPFLVVQGAEDRIVPPSQSRELVARLDAAGDRATLIMVHNAGHGLVPRGRGPVSPTVVAVAASVVTFLTRVIPPTG